MGAAIALAIAVAAACGAVLTMALKAIAESNERRKAERRELEQKNRADLLDVNLTSVAGQLADATTQLKDARERLDEFEVLVIQQAAGMPADGAFARLLARRKAAAGTQGDHGDGAGPLLREQAPARDDPNGLFKPGD